MGPWTVIPLRSKNLGVKTREETVSPTSTASSGGGSRAFSAWPSFDWLAPTLRVLRQIAKDFWYRNRQERQLGEIELQMAQLRLAYLQKELWVASAEMRQRLQEADRVRTRALEAQLDLELT